MCPGAGASSGPALPERGSWRSSVPGPLVRVEQILTKAFRIHVWLLKPALLNFCNGGLSDPK